MVLRHGTASGHGKVVEILANVMVLLSRLTRQRPRARSLTDARLSGASHQPGRPIVAS